MEKRCGRCGSLKPMSAFDVSSKTGKAMAYCAPCYAKAKVCHKRWLDRNPGLAAKRTAQWRYENREQALAAQRDCNQRLKDAAYAAYGGYVCACCGETEKAFLTIDHVNNDGAKHRREVDRRKIYKWLARNGYPNDFQVLCMNCNFGKARNGGVCPHQTSLKVQRPELRLVASSDAKRAAPPEGDEDMVSSAWQHAAASKDAV